VRAFEPKTADIRSEQRIVGDPRYGAERPVIVEMLRRLRAASAPHDYFDLHLELFRRFKSRQDRIGGLKVERSRHQQRRTELAAQTLRDVPAIAAAQHEAETVAQAIEVEEALLSLLRVIGDGIAWRAMGYDRAAFGILGVGTRVGRLAADEGLDPEIAQLEAFWQDGVFAIHNDLTSCLRHGDVTAVYPDGRREVVEVKRSRTNPNSVQMIRLKDATDLINNRRHTYADGTVRDIVAVPTPYKTRLGHLPGMIATARQKGYADKRLSRCQWSAVTSNLLNANQVEHAREEHERSMQELGWANVRSFTYNSGFRRMRDRKHSFPTLAPLSIYPLDVEDVADLMLGYFDLFAMLNVDVLARQLAERGIDVQITIDDDAGSNFLVATRRVGDRELVVNVDPSLREQLLMELMRPEIAIAAVKAVLDAVEAEPGPDLVERIVSFADEAAVWEARR
jgi:hypothetical protein